MRVPLLRDDAAAGRARARRDPLGRLASKAGAGPRDVGFAGVAVAIVTGSGGLVGSESAAHFIELGFDVIGIENDMRSYFFGPSASTAPRTDRLLAAYPGAFRSIDIDIRDFDAVNRVFTEHARQ